MAVTASSGIPTEGAWLDTDARRDALGRPHLERLEDDEEALLWSAADDAEADDGGAPADEASLPETACLAFEKAFDSFDITPPM